MCGGLSIDTWLRALPKLSPSRSQLWASSLSIPPRSWLNHLRVSGLPQLVSLTLHTNNLTSLAEEVINDLPRLQSLRLEHNKLACDCELGWILDHETLAPLARCVAPPALANKRIVELKREQLECGADHRRGAGAECREGAGGVTSQCPAQCKCVHGIVDCRNRGLVTVPDTLPLDTTEMWVRVSVAFTLRFFVISYKSSIIILIQISKFAKVCKLTSTSKVLRSCERLVF